MKKYRFSCITLLMTIVLIIHKIYTYMNLIKVNKKNCVHKIESKIQAIAEHFSCIKQIHVRASYQHF